MEWSLRFLVVLVLCSFCMSYKSKCGGAVCLLLNGHMQEQPAWTLYKEGVSYTMVSAAMQIFIMLFVSLIPCFVRTVVNKKNKTNQNNQPPSFPSVSVANITKF